MGQYLVRRLLIAIPTLLLISFVLFAILALAPGDPLSQFAANPAVPPRCARTSSRSLGLDQPWPIRYVKWLLAGHGDWGFSFASRIQVWDLIKLRIPSTLAVVGIAYLFSLCIAIPIGILSAVKQYSLFDHIATTFAFIGFSVPTFFTGLLLIIIFSVKLQWLPLIYDSTLQVRDMASLGAQFKQSIMPIAGAGAVPDGDVRALHARIDAREPAPGLRPHRARQGPGRTRVIGRHVVRNSLIPVVTLIALTAPTVFSGAVITEQIFRVPGIGALLITSIQNNDIPVIMAITFTFSVLVVILNLVADVMYGLLDPRIRYD